MRKRCKAFGSSIRSWMSRLDKQRSGLKDAKAQLKRLHGLQKQQKRAHMAMNGA